MNNEKSTKHIKEYFENIEVPNELDEAIKKGLLKANLEEQEVKVKEDVKEAIKVENKKKFKYKNMLILACGLIFIILVGFNLKASNSQQNTNIANEKLAIKLPNIKDEKELKNILESIEDIKRSIFKVDVNMAVSDYNKLGDISEKSNQNNNKTQDVKEEKGLQSISKDKQGSFASSEKTKNEEFSKTNNQVENVDEGDIVKTDGNYIYTVKNIYNRKDFKCNSVISIIKADNGIMTKVANINLERKVNSLYLNKDRLIVISDSLKKEVITNVSVYNIKDVKSPSLERSIDYLGTELSSRLVNGKLVLILDKYISKNMKIDEIMPKCYDTLSKEEKTAKLQDIKYCPGIDRESLISLVSINVEDIKEEMKVEHLLASAKNIYCSENNVYLYSVNKSIRINHKENKNDKQQENEYVSSIYKFSLKDFKLLASTKVKGSILNQFSLDEKGDSLRVATTTNLWNENKANNVYVLDKNLKELSKLEDLAKGEKIYSTRYINDMLYIVTFKKIDPLFAIDLKDEKNIKVIGQVKLPGFSNYLHPLDNKTLIGIGEERDENGKNRKGIKLSLFDVADNNNPKESFNKVVGDKYSYSNLDYNHKVFFINKRENIIGIPIENYDKEGRNEVSFYFSKVSKNDGFKELGCINFDISQKNEKYLNSSDIRAIYIGEYIYIILNEQIYSCKMQNLDVVNKIEY